ncbi:MAG: hypothetical protein M1572_03360 [Gammaproteobacteria bacterium]|nr:hypothetical protein [Gammaproteobacteria bacterium]
MKTIILTITLAEDTIFSEHAATEGGHKSLSYVPGSTLLGCVAGKLYRQLTPARAWDFFHSGKVRFTNGYPLSNTGKPSYPAPNNWHHTKENANQVFIGSKYFSDENKQPKQVRAGFYTEDRESVAVLRESRMKTAVDPTTRMAKDAQLFDYQFIPANYRFRSEIHIDDDIEQSTIDNLLKLFNGKILLGRSRSAEYGQAKVTAELSTNNKATSYPSNGNMLTIWLQSDLCLIDANGQPNLHPSCLSQLNSNLPKAPIDLANSYIRKRSYNVWNAFKKSYDTERQVITAGSILTYDLAQPLTSEQVALCQQGFGLYRENGLGQVLLNHPLTITSDAGTSFPVTKDSVAPKQLVQASSNHPLLNWLMRQQSGKTDFDKIRNQAKEEASNLIKFYESNRRMLGLTDDIAIGPSKSQWGSVLTAAKTPHKEKTLTQQLFESNDAIVKDNKPGWQDKFWDGDKLMSFEQWFKSLCNNYKGDLTTFVQHLAHEAQNTLNQKGAKS